MNIHFEKAALRHIDIIFNWLQEKHIQDFWDNSQNQKDDILNFIHEKPQKYFAGTTKYWVGYIDDEPYAFILSDILATESCELKTAIDDYMDTKLKEFQEIIKSKVESVITDKIQTAICIVAISNSPRAYIVDSNITIVY